ncbi:MAG: NADH-quinone oxidoreductase subunit C, partial [Bacteroidota bacterium]
MTAQEIQALLQEEIGENAVTEANVDVLQPWLVIAKEHLLDVMQFLRDDKRCYFDFLECLSGVDAPKAGHLIVVYHLSSIPRGHSIVLKVHLPREPEPDQAHEGGGIGTGGIARGAGGGGGGARRFDRTHRLGRRC